MLIILDSCIINELQLVMQLGLMQDFYHWFFGLYKSDQDSEMLSLSEKMIKLKLGTIPRLFLCVYLELLNLSVDDLQLERFRKVHMFEGSIWKWSIWTFWKMINLNILENFQFGHFGNRQFVRPEHFNYCEHCSLS